MSVPYVILAKSTNRKEKIMAHNLEMNGNEVAFALRGKPAWHNLANRIFTQDEEVTTQTMLEEAKLANWNVRLSPITEHIPESWNDVSTNDETKLYLIVWTSHDGSVAVQAAVTPVRVVCQNTLNLAMRNAKQSFKIRHTQSVEGRIQVARETLGLALGYFDEFEKEAQALYSQSITDKQFSDLIKTIYPKPEKDSKGALKKWENKVVLLDDLYHNSPTNATIKGTKWGAFNALTERLDYYRTARGNSESLMAGASGFDPVLTAEKNKIKKLVSAF